MANTETKLELPLSQLQESNDVCYQNLAESNNSESSETLIDVTDCESDLTTGDKLELKDSILSSLDQFFVRHNIKTPDGVLQIVHSMTYGEMLICFLLFLILVIMVIKWFWEVLRY